MKKMTMQETHQTVRFRMTQFPFIPMIKTKICRIAELDKDLEGKEKTSAAVATSLAELINKKFRSKLSEEKTKDRMEKYMYVRPKNCGALQTPLVHPEIWKSMTGEARNSDIKCSHMQKAIATAGTALAESTQTLIHAKKNADAESRKKIGEDIEKNGDAIFLNANLAGLCSDSVPVSDKWLFGDNLATSTKDIKEMDKLGSSLTPVAGPSGTQKAKYGGANAMTNYRYKAHFLGKKNSHWSHQRGRGSQTQRHFGGKARPQYRRTKAQNWSISIILRVLQKVRREKASGVIIVPEWKTQVWWPVLLKLLTTDPVRLPSSINLLSLPSHPRTRHRLLPRLQLLACKISGAD
ncbi:hypothetical protein V1264_012315 [Littorina saxatilis]|uniref:Uncharacterized protein n=1 Tax=Littorina saxatilis TaxID=31220 RepID=A0AAN9BWX7_9CAEN